jgi:hypothetical protein
MLPAIGKRLALVLAILIVPAATAAEGDPPRPRYTPAERMTPARLKAAHEDAARIGQGRRRPDPLPGLNDYRAILHAHAEDSAHTGGTRPEMLADAKLAGVDAVLLTDHHRPPKDFIADSWRGLHDGVLFIPGSEDRGFLIYPARSIMGRMKDPKPAFLEAVRDGGGLAFLSHVEERPDHPMDGLDGLEITNRHADAKVDRAGLVALMLRLTDPASLAELEESLRLYPDELYAAQARYPAEYLAKWDAETKTRRLTGVAANDCHHNNVLVVKMVDAESVKVGTNVDKDDAMRTIPASLRPGIRALTKGRKPGDVLARLDVDPYRVSFRNMSTHILAPRLDEPSVREALRAGRAYVAHDWICDPSGFRFEWLAEGSLGVMGDAVPVAPGGRLFARFPAACHIRLLRDGRPIAEATSDRLEHPVAERGVYRVEGWLTLDGEERPWIYSNPIYVH